MALNSINTNIAAYYAQANIGKASNMATKSIARLSSGDRIVQASDDVAAMSAGTSLRTNVTTLRMALVNTSQGTSLLQVADGALSQVTDILQRQKAIAVQAGAGNLTSQERSFLNQEFQNLSSEIDRLATQTNFNGVALLDGSLSERVNVADNDSAATSASASISFLNNVTAGQTLLLNGVTVTEGTDFNLAGTISQTIDNLVTFLNSSTNVNLSQAEYARNGNSLEITARNGGVGGETYTIDQQGGTYTATGANTNVVISGGSSSSYRNLGTTNGIGVTSVTDVATNGNTTATQVFKVGETIKLKVGAGATTTVHTFTSTDTLESIVQGINNDFATTGVTARIIGRAGAYNIEFEHSQSTSNGTTGDLTITAANLNGAIVLANANTTIHQQVFSLDGADDVGIGVGDTTGFGVIGNNIITQQNQLKSSVQLIFPEIADNDLLTQFTTGANRMEIQVGDPGAAGDGRFVSFFFTDGGGGPTEASIGATLEETLDNMVSAINSYDGNGQQNYDLSQIRARRDGNNIILETVDVGNGSHLNTPTNTAVALDININNGITGASITNNGTFNNGNTGGVNTSGVTNKDFIGQITGFSATYTGTANTVNLSVTVGDNLYTVNNIGTNPAANTTVRLTSQDGGGYFDIQLAANSGETVGSQADADVLAQRINAAFESLDFYQNRTVSSYSGGVPIITDGVVSGSLIGTNVELQGTSFDAVKIDQIRVNAPVGSSENGSIEITIDGEVYSSSPTIGSQLGANQSFRLVSASDANKYLTFTTGNTAIEFDTDAKATTFQAALESAFGVGDGSAQLQFQVGVTTTDVLRVGINNITTNIIFEGATLDVLTQANASAASDAIDAAIDAVTAVRAEVGALQSRFTFAAANVESSIQNQDAARGVLLDTDVAAEATSFATSQVQLQAGIAVLAQANLLPQQLLKLIG